MKEAINFEEIKIQNASTRARKLAKEIHGGEIIGLIGELGSGKTTFTQYLGKYLGINQNIASPTFVLHKIYLGKLNNGKKIFFHHLDVYRLSSQKDITGLGLEEIFSDPNAIVIIEWADKIHKWLPNKTKYFKLINQETK